MEVNTPDTEGAPAGETEVTVQSNPEVAAPDNAALAAELDAVKKSLADLTAKSAEYLDGWQRARAEFANYKKRQEADFANLRAISTSSLLSKLIPVLDDFERATKTLAPSLRDMTWIEGVLLIHRKLQLILESEGIRPIEVKPNDLFDPAVHEAVSHDEAEGIESGHVIEELQKGYKLGDRVIRPTLVRVAR